MSWARRADRRPVDPGPVGSTRWPAVLSLMAAGVVAAGQVGKGAAALPVLQAEFGLTATSAAWYLSAMSALGALAGTVLGWAGQALGFRRQVLLGLAAIGVSNVAGAAATGSPGLLGSRVGEGMGFVLVALAVPGLLPGLAAPGQRRLVTGAWGAYMPVGSGLAALLVPPAVGVVGRPGTWLLDAGLAALACVAVLRRVPSTPARSRPGVAGLLGAVRSPGVLCLAAVFALYGGTYLAVLGLLPAALVADGSLPLHTAGLLGGLAFLANAPGNLAGAYLHHRGVPRWRLVVVGSAAMAGTVWVGQDPDLPIGLRIGALVLFSLIAGLVPPALFSGVAAMTAGTATAGASVGLLTQGSSIGQLLVPPLVVAAGATAPGWPVQAATLSGLAALAALGGVVLRRWDTTA